MCTKKGEPTYKYMESCTENALTAGMFLATHSLPHRMWPYLCDLLQLISPASLPQPAGNRHMSYNSMRLIHSANFRSVRETVKKLLVM